MEQRLKGKVILFPRRICETRAGNLAHTVGRLAFQPGRPMLIEHVGGIYLEHDLSGAVLTDGYGAEYNIMHVWIMHVWEDEALQMEKIRGVEGS